MSIIRKFRSLVTVTTIASAIAVTPLAAPVLAPTDTPVPAASSAPVTAEPSEPSTSATAPAGGLTATPAPTPRFADGTPAMTTRMAAVGDSITAFVNRSGVTTPWSWVRTAATGNVVDAGGYRMWGENTDMILAGATPVSADVAVVMAGTNDILDGSVPIPTERTLANIAAIFDRIGAPVRVLSAVAPKDGPGAAPTLALNAALRDLADRNDWAFVDPWTSVRAADGQWTPGASGDGVHPTAESGATAGAAIREAVIAARSSRY